MHNLRHPAFLTLALVFVTLLALASVGGRASANGTSPDSDYRELLSLPGTPEDIGKRNALDQPMFEGLVQAGKDLAADPSVRVAVRHGEGRRDHSKSEM